MLTRFEKCIYSVVSILMHLAQDSLELRYIRYKWNASASYLLEKVTHNFSDTKVCCAVVLSYSALFCAPFFFRKMLDMPYLTCSQFIVSFSTKNYGLWAFWQHPLSNQSLMNSIKLFLNYIKLIYYFLPEVCFKSQK